jgi:hypothetical protein
MLDQTLRPIAAFAFDALLDQIDPHGQGLDDATREARRRCGQWLAVRRLHLGLTSSMVQQRTGLEPQHLLLLETGLATPAIAPAEVWYRLCLVLERDYDLEWVAAVVHSALGYESASLAPLAERVGAQLTAAVENVPAFLPIPDLPNLNHEAFLVLEALRDGERNALGVRDKLAALAKGAPAIGLATIHALLPELLDQGMIERRGLPSAAPDKPASVSYHLTQYGAVVVQLKDQMRPLVEQEARLKEQEEQLKMEEAWLKEQNRRVQEAKQRVLRRLSSGVI